MKSKKSLTFVEKLRTLPWSHIVFALTLILVGLAVLPHGQSDMVEVRRTVGSTLIALGLVSVVYDYLFVRRVIGGYFELLKAAAGLELDRIYVNRAQALGDIAAEMLRASGSVKMSAVSGSDFFSEGPLAKAISRVLEESHNAHLRFLLLKRSSRYAFLRAWIEENYDQSEENQQELDDDVLRPAYSRDEFAKSVMKSRLSSAVAAVRNMRHRLVVPTRLSVRFYRYQPSIFLVAVNEWIFVETYVWGVDRNYRPNAVAPYIAKRLPVFKFRRGSFSGVIFENHFDRLWRCSHTERFIPPAAEEAITRDDHESVLV